MKKILVVLTTVLSLAISAPIGASAQANVSSFDLQHVKNIQGFGDVTIQELMLSKGGLLNKDGEIEYTFDYDTSYGSTIRYYLGDSNQVGMTIKIYDQSNNPVADGHTSSSNGWQYQSTFTPANKSQTYTVRIVSDDGDGGFGYGYDVAVRAF